MMEFCVICFSQGRRSTSLCNIKHILDYLNWSDIKCSTDAERICWECHAVLQKAYTFRRQALSAQDILTSNLCTNKHLGLESVSHLSTSYKNSFDDCVVYEMKVEAEMLLDNDNNVKFDSEAKIEKCDDDHDNHDDFYVIDIKKEKHPSEIEIEHIDNETKSRKTKNVKKKKLKDKKDKSNEEIVEAWNLSKDEEKFIVKKMSHEEMEAARERDRNLHRYKTCPFKCVKCITGYFTVERYNAHMRIKHLEEIGEYICSICEVRFKRQPALDYHYDCHFRMYQCKQCEFKHHRLNTALIHLNNQHELEQYECTVCGEGFVKMRQLRYHCEKTHKETPTCKLCGKTYVTMYNLKKHITMAHENPPLETCGVCGGRYRCLSAHLRTHAPPAEGAYCAECGEQFRSVHIYRRHLVSHAKHRHETVLKHICPHCDARFTNNTSLSRHISSKHTKEYPFTCNSCGKGFSRKDRLKNHIQEKHEGIPRPKNKICSYCGKGFKDSQVLVNHLRTHTGQKPYNCAHCPWSFAQRTSLTAHMRALHKNEGC